MRKTQSPTKKNVPVNQTVELLTNATWSFAHSVLWNGHPFSEETTILCKKYIREYYENIPKEKIKFAPNYFSRYCERVTLAKAYVNKHPGRYIPHPAIWLNRNNPKGFAGTKTWLQRIMERRKMENTILQSVLYSETILLKHKNSLFSRA
jgi:hypothetical protein